MDQLSNEEEILLFKYLENDMTLEERFEFETRLKKSKVLLEELEFERRLLQLGKSVNAEMQKYDDEKIQDNDLLYLIEKAKEKGQNHETYVGAINGVPPGEVQERLITPKREIDDRPVGEIGSDSIFGKEKPNVKRIHLIKWLAVAVVIGIIFLGATIWYSQNQNNPRPVAANKTSQDSRSGNDDTKQAADVKMAPQTTSDTDRPASKSNGSGSNRFLSDRRPAGASKNAGPTPSSQTPHVATRPGFGQGKKHPSSEPTVHKNSSSNERLFARSFAPDNLPSKIPAPLEDPSNGYKRNDYTKAIDGYAAVLREIEDSENLAVKSRGNRFDKELVKFYGQYYIALSYLAVNDTVGNNAQKAIHELESALKLAREGTWKIKSRWYLALAYLKAGQMPKAEILLDDVARTSTYAGSRDPREAIKYRRQALKLIKEIGKFK